MVTEEAYATLEAENASLRHDLTVVREEVVTALQRIRELEGKKTPPSSFVKANTPALTKRERQRRVAPLFADLQALGARFVSVLDHPCRALAWRLWHFQHELLTCLAVPGVPPDNNAAERAIRPLVITRMISGGTRSPTGSTIHLRRSSLAATWTAPGHNPLTQFRQLLSGPFPQV